MNTVNNDQTRTLHRRSIGSLVSRLFGPIAHSPRGHVRPLLHTSLNILVAHPGLHLTLLLIPSVIKQVESELASPACAYIYQTPQDGTKGISGRLQIIPVHSPQFELPEQFSPNTMAEEAMDFAQAVPSFLESVILGKPEVDGTKDVNKFAHLPPNFIVFDVSTWSALFAPLPMLILLAVPHFFARGDDFSHVVVELPPYHGPWLLPV